MPLNALPDCVELIAAVAFDLAFRVFEGQHIFLRGAFQGKLSAIAVGAGDVVTLLLELDDADRGAPFTLKRASSRCGCLKSPPR